MNSGDSPGAERWIGRLERAAARAEDALLVLLLGLMIGLAAFQILLRNVWDSGLVWGDPLLRVLVLWVGLLGALAATRDGRHITVDVLSRFLPPRARAAGRRLTDLFTAAVCALLAWHSARLVYTDWQFATPAFGPVPAWLCELILPLGFGLIALRFFQAFVKSFFFEHPAA